MGTLDFKQATALVASDDLLFRKRVVNALQGVSFAQVTDLSDIAAVDAALAGSVFDLLLVTPRLGGQLLTSLLGQLRDGRHAHHPFPLVIILASDADKEILAKIVNCGPDDVVLIPVDPQHLLARVVTHVQVRKPFVVTGDFVGPDRRKDERSGGDTAPTIEAPNPLVGRLRKVSESVMAAEIAAARARLNTIKIERAIHELGWLNRAISRLLGEPPVDTDKLEVHLGRLVQIAKGLPIRFAVADAAAQMAAAAKTFAQGVASLEVQALDWDRLVALTGALVAGINASVEAK